MAPLPQRRQKAATARMVGPAGVVWAVDIHQPMLARVHNLAIAEGLHNVHVVHGNVEQLGGSKLPSSTFDVVIVANVLFTLEHPAGLVAEAWRVLRPGGVALVVDWAGSFGGLGPHPGHVVARADMLQLFLADGFGDVVDIPAGAYHWGFVVRKQDAVSAQ